MTEDDVPGWNGDRRADATTVAKSLKKAWVVRPPDGRPAIAHCPTCGKEFKTARAAKRVAGAVYPSN
jgi:hypothetical protein